MSFVGEQAGIYYTYMLTYVLAPVSFNKCYNLLRVVIARMEHTHYKMEQVTGINLSYIDEKQLHVMTTE